MQFVQENPLPGVPVAFGLTACQLLANGQSAMRYSPCGCTKRSPVGGALAHHSKPALDPDGAGATKDCKCLANHSALSASPPSAFRARLPPRRAPLPNRKRRPVTQPASRQSSMPCSKPWMTRICRAIRGQAGRWPALLTENATYQRSSWTSARNSSTSGHARWERPPALRVRATPLFLLGSRDNESPLGGVSPISRNAHRQAIRGAATTGLTFWEGPSRDRLAVDLPKLPSISPTKPSEMSIVCLPNNARFPFCGHVNWRSGQLRGARGSSPCRDAGCRSRWRRRDRHLHLATLVDWYPFDVSAQVGRQQAHQA